MLLALFAKSFPESSIDFIVRILLDKLFAVKLMLQWYIWLWTIKKESTRMCSADKLLLNISEDSDEKHWWW